MAFTTTATQAEFRTLWEAVVKLGNMLNQYASGAATKDKPGRFTEAEVVAGMSAVTAAITAVNS